MEERYKGWNIEYIENGGAPRFKATKEAYSLTSQRLRDLKRRIDEHVKEKFQRVNVYFKDWSQIKEAEITSIAEEDGKGFISELWLSVTNHTGDKTRSKERITTFNQRLYTKNEKNKQIFDEVNILNKSIAEIQHKINTLEEGLEKFDVQTLRKQYELKGDVKKNQE